jgi:hypothetical protein
MPRNLAYVSSEKGPSPMERSKRMGARPLPLLAAMLLAVLLTWGMSEVLPTPHDALGWTLRAVLLAGMWWAVR